MTSPDSEKVTNNPLASDKTQDVTDCHGFDSYMEMTPEGKSSTAEAASSATDGHRFESYMEMTPEGKSSSSTTEAATEDYMMMGKEEDSYMFMGSRPDQLPITTHTPAG